MDYKSLESLIQQTMLVVLISHAVMNLAAPLTGTLAVSWQWQVSINPQKGSPFWGCLQSFWGIMKPQSRAQCLLHAGCIIHSHKHTVELIKQNICVLRKQRDSSECYYLGLKIPDEPTVNGVMNGVGFMISEEEDLTSRPGTRLDYSRAFV